MRVFALAVAVPLGGAGFIYREPLLALFHAPPPVAPEPEKDVVQVAAPQTIHVEPDSVLEKSLSFDTVRRQTVDVPALTVTGSVMARLPPGRDDAQSRWDFATPEVAATYADWVKARADVAFYQGQAVEIKKLAESRVDFWVEEVKRLTELVKIGAESKSNLAQTKFNHDQAVLQRRKDVYEADKAVETANRNRGLNERVLLQAGVDPQVVSRGTEGLALVVADVPEASVAQVRVGQECAAKFYSYPDWAPNGPVLVSGIGPSLSKERRTLRVTFELHDPGGKLLPGMFAEIGLGAKKREALTVAADAVLHAGKADYVLVEVDAGNYRACPVRVGTPVPADSAEKPRLIVETGLREHCRVVGGGAILLKPVMMKALGGAEH